MRPTISAWLLPNVGELAALALDEMYAAPRIERLPHSFADSRHTPVSGSWPVGCDGSGAHVATSAFEVKMIGSSFVPLAKICAPRDTTSVPPMNVSLAI